MLAKAILILKEDRLSNSSPRLSLPETLKAEGISTIYYTLERETEAVWLCDKPVEVTGFDSTSQEVCLTFPHTLSVSATMLPSQIAPALAFIVFLPPFPQASLSSEKSDLMEESHLGPSVLRSRTLHSV